MYIKRQSIPYQQFLALFSTSRNSVRSGGVVESLFAVFVASVKVTEARNHGNTINYDDDDNDDDDDNGEAAFTATTRTRLISQRVYESRYVGTDPKGLDKRKVCPRAREARTGSLRIPDLDSTACATCFDGKHPGTLARDRTVERAKSATSHLDPRC